MTFRLFGVNVEIQAFFWVNAVLIGWSMARNNGPVEILLGVLIVFVSVLAHEFGHALAIMRHKVEPEISLHGMGGTTRWRVVLPLRRIDQILISLAGPFMNFLIAGLIYAAYRLAPGALMRLPSVALHALGAASSINLFWGVLNLLPVLPLDGGHVLEQALGPKRIRITLGISFLAGAGLTVLGLAWHQYWIALIFGMGAFSSYQRFREESADGGESAMPPARRKAPDSSEGIAPELMALLQSARHAVAEEQTARAMTLAQQVLGGDGGTIPVSPRAVLQALEIITWAHLLDGRLDQAADTLAQIRKMGEPDAALAGAVALARKDLRDARRVLEAARARGDDRKEVVGPLIQVLIEQGEIARAAAVAFDIVDSLSDDDARRMAQIAFESRSFDWSARLYEAIFDRHKRPDDAYDAARAHAQDDRPDRALDMLRKAVETGFSDRARAWSDAALEGLRRGQDLEALLPRP